MRPEQVQDTEVRNYRRELNLSEEAVSDSQLRAAIAEVEPWLFEDELDRHALLVQAIASPGSTLE